MRYGGSEALSYDMVAYDSQTAASTLLPIEGGRLDARAREGVSAAFKTVVALVVTLMIMLVTVGAINVTLTTGTVRVLQSSQDLTSHIKEVRRQNIELREAHALLTRGERIELLATQRYDMVYDQDAERLTLD